MPKKQRALLPREGFTIDVVISALKNTLFNPSIVVPLFLWSRFSGRGIDWSTRNPSFLKHLKSLLAVTLITRGSSYLTGKAQNNWKKDVYDWKKEIVVVTGGSDGIGKLVVQDLAERGIKVVVIDVQELTYEAPSHVHYFKCDLTSASEIASVAESIKTSVGEPTILINNAGIARNKTILDTTSTDLRLTFGVNTLSHYALAQAFLPSMITNNHGMVVTVASLAAHVTAPGMVDYAASKAAALAFHEGLGAELATNYNAPKVRTVLVCQGYTQTSLFQGFDRGDGFVSYPLAPETVADGIVEKVIKGEGGHVLLPKVVGHLSERLRTQPLWYANRVRHNAVVLMSKFQGRMVKQPSEMEESWVKES